MYVLSNWKIASCATSTGAVVTLLCGHVFGHPRFSSGEFIQTSTVKNHRIEFDSLIVVTRNGSEYWLGKPDPAESFSMQRLLRYLQESESVQLMTDSTEATRLPGGLVVAGRSMRKSEAHRPAANLTMFRRRATDAEGSAANDQNDGVAA